MNTKDKPLIVYVPVSVEDEIEAEAAKYPVYQEYDPPLRPHIHQTFSDACHWLLSQLKPVPIEQITGKPSDKALSAPSRLKMVVGFMFNKNETDVLLIAKNKPSWQKGKLNGIGGKVEVGETYHEAMRREFIEETGIQHDSWHPVILMYGDDWEVQVFTAKSDDVFYFKQMEAEKVHLIPIRELDAYAHVSNLQWLIPMCLDTNDGKGRIDYCLSLNEPASQFEQITTNPLPAFVDFLQGNFYSYNPHIGKWFKTSENDKIVFYETEKVISEFYAGLSTNPLPTLSEKEDDVTSGSNSNPSSLVTPHSSSGNSVEQVEAEYLCRGCKRPMDEDEGRWGFCHECYTEA